MTRDQMVFTACFGIACFWLGLYVGEEQGAVKLQPCPLAQREGCGELIRTERPEVRQVCTYATIEKNGKKYSIKGVVL